MKMAPEREETANNGVHQVMRRRKSLYGIPQAPANWHGTIDDFVITIGFKPLKSDPCIYTYTHKNGIYNSATKKGPTSASWNKDTSSSPSTSMIFCWWGRTKCCSSS